MKSHSIHVYPLFKSWYPGKNHPFFRVRWRQTQRPMEPYGAMVMHRHVRYRFTPSPRRRREGRGRQLPLFSTLSQFSASSLHFKYNHWLEISTRSILVCNSWTQLDPPPEVLPARSTSDARHSLDPTFQTGHGAAGTAEKTLAVARPCESTGQT